MSDTNAGDRRPGPRWLYRDPEVFILFAVFASVAAAMFTPSVEQGAGTGGSPERDDHPGGGVIVESRVVDVWLPRPWIDAARRASVPIEAQGWDDLRTLLRRPRDAGVRYAITVRSRQVDGGVTTITFLREPRPEYGNLQEFIDVLNTAAGLPTRRPDLDYTDAAVHVIHDVASRPELLEAVRASSPTPGS